MTKQELDNMTEKELQEIAEEEDWNNIDEIRKGYAVFSADYMDGALHVERLDFLDVYESDREASIQAEKDGAKIIHDLPISEDDYDYAYFIDTPENREVIRKHLLSRGIKW